VSLVLGRFLQALRAAEVRVSSSEGMDAARAFSVLGLANRTLLKRGLAQVLAKTTEDKQRFDDCFEQFFRSEDFALLDSDPAATDQPDVSSEVGAAVLPADASILEQMLAEGDRAGLQLALAEAAQVARVQEIRLFTQRGLYARRMLEAMGVVAVEQRMAALRAAGDAAGAGALQQSLAQLREEVTAHVERQIVLLTANAGTRLREEILREVPLSRAEYSDFTLMQALVRKLARRLVALHSRRRRVDDRGRLDVRHTLRRNIQYDGLLFDIVWKQRRIDRPKVVAVCDVSGSVASMARFLLLFLYSVSEVLPKVRAFVFSAELAEVTSLFETLPVEDAVATTLKRHGWGSTDYGRALGQLRKEMLDEIDHRTTVLILGDGRSNHGDPGHRDLHRIHERAGRVVWLNPEPRVFWNTGDSEMRRLAAACDQVESCRSLRQLENIINALMRMRT
jgi:uncharacterized protein with von Willebrand factor type A (vWA) domain